MNNTAATYTKTSFAARNLLLLLYGEEYPIDLPSLDNLVTIAIGFKTQTLTKATKGLYPNPANDHIQYNATRLPSDINVSINIYSPQGQNILKYAAKGGSILSISTDKLPAGIYFYEISHNSQVVLKDKIVLIK